MKTPSRSSALRITELAVLSAIIILMAFTPLGYLKVGPLSITFLVIPVVLGAILLGPADGAILGAVFGATSFAQCFGMDAFGTTLLNLNAAYTFLMCFVPRILIGLVSGYLVIWLEKLKLNKFTAFALAGLAGALTNTVFFVGLLLAFFGQTPFIKSFGDTVFKVIGVLVTTNSLVEAISCTVIVAVVARAVYPAVKKLGT